MQRKHYYPGRIHYPPAGDKSGHRDFDKQARKIANTPGDFNVQTIILLPAATSLSAIEEINAQLATLPRFMRDHNHIIDDIHTIVQVNRDFEHHLHQVHTVGYRQTGPYGRNRKTQIVHGYILTQEPSQRPIHHWVTGPTGLSSLPVQWIRQFLITKNLESKEQA